MKRRQKSNFVDDVKFVQPGRRSRTSKVDLLNGEGIGEDLGLVQESFNAIGLFAPKDPVTLDPGGPSIPVLPQSPITVGPDTSDTASPINTPVIQSISLNPIVDAGPDQQITLPTSTTTLQGNVQGKIATYKTWSFINGPSGASPQISNPGSLQTDVSGLTIAGDYTFQLYAINTGISGPQTPNQFNNSADTVIITVLPNPVSQPPLPPPTTTPPTSTTPDMPPPADDATIDGWDCSTLNTYLNVYNQTLSDPTISQQTRNSYENALLRINNRINTICTPSTIPHIEVPESAPPLPTTSDIDAMNCDQLNSLKTALVTNEATYRTDATTLQNYINTVNYVDLQFTQKCKNTTPTAPTVEIYAPGTTPYATGVKSTGGAGGGGGSSSGSTPQSAQNYKHWWWIGVVVVVGALILFKPGTKIGVPSK